MIWQAILQNSFLMKKYPSTHTQKNVKEINNEFSNSKQFCSTSLIYFYFFLYPLLSSNIQMLVGAVMVKLKIYQNSLESTRILIHIFVLRVLFDIISDLPKMSQEKKG